jgi:hypothetical protein
MTNAFTWAAPVALSLVAAAAAPVSAQPAPPPPPPTVEDPVASPDGYPLDLVDRPLMLPASMAEVDGHFTFITEDNVDLGDYILMTVSGRYSTGSFEPFAGLDLAIATPGDGGSTLSRLFAGARAPVGPGFAKLTASRYAPTDSFSNLGFDGRFEYKQTLAPKFAAVAEGGLQAQFVTVSDPFGAGSDVSGNIFSLVGRGAGQVQVAPAAALQAGLELNLPIAHGGDLFMNTDPDTVTTLFGEGLYSMGKFDIYARLEILMAGDADATDFIVGALARPM